MITTDRRRAGLLAAAGVLALVAGPALAQERWLTLPELPPAPHADAEGYVDHEGARLFWRSFGAGAPVILLHGGFADGRYWAAQVPALLGAGYRAILIDSRGHGRSRRDDRPLTYELMASDVVAVMDRLRLPRAAVVGWSDGAIIGLVMALRDPERLTRVFAFAANMDPSGVKPDTEANPTFARFLARAQGDYARLSPTPREFARFRAAVERMWATEPNYSATDLARIHTPVAIVDGDHDEAIKPEHTEYLARAIPGARLVILPGVSHFAMLQDPAAFDAAMLAFLKG